MISVFGENRLYIGEGDGLTFKSEMIGNIIITHK
jgi:hypothetical protein